jgi:hypothetical protein
VKSKVLGYVRPPRPENSPTFAGMTPRKIADAVSERLKPFREALRSFASFTTKASPLSPADFLSRYGGAKRKCYESAMGSMELHPFDIKDARVKSFTKDEYLKPGGAPRVIQPRSPRFNCHLGRHIKDVEHDIFKAIDHVFDSTGQHQTVAKGMNMNERGKVIAEMWSSFDNPVAVGLDASRFDQHCNDNLLNFEHSIYPLFCEGLGDVDLVPLKQLLRHQLVNTGRYYGKDGTIKYRVKGGRMSGDMNTSSGNVIIMCALMYSYISSKKLRGRVMLLNDGDDCVLVMDEKTRETFTSGLKEWFLDMGITMEYDGVYRYLEEIEFCQARPLFDSQLGYRLVPRPSKRLYSDLVSTKDLSVKKVHDKWLGAVAGCGLASCSGVPVFQEFYTWLAKEVKPYIPEFGSPLYRYRQELVNGMTMRYRVPNVEERISFFHAFDITPAEQETLEEYFRNLPAPQHSAPVEITHQYLDLQQHLCPPEQKEDPHNHYCAGLLG